jgi:hypothetical protein
VSGADSGVLVIHDVQTGDAGSYVAYSVGGCEASLAEGVQLTVVGGCAADLDGDGVVSGSDLALIFVAWGGRDPVADLDGDGVVGGSDIGLLFQQWGPCR